MPLKYDSEFKDELNAVVAEAKRRSRKPYAFVIFSVAILCGIIGVLATSGLPDVYLVTGTLVACTAYISWHLAWEAKAVHLQMVTLIAVVEWVGRKQLGEYVSSPTVDAPAQELKSRR